MLFVFSEELFDQKRPQISKKQGQPFNLVAVVHRTTISLLLLTISTILVKAQLRNSFLFGLYSSTTTPHPLLVEQKTLFASQVLFEGDIANSHNDPLETIAKFNRYLNKTKHHGDDENTDYDEETDSEYSFASVRELNERWPTKAVPYKFHPSVSSAFKQRLINATKYIMARTCVSFVAFDAEKHDYSFTFYEVPGDYGCSSTIGRSNNSYIALQKECADGNIIHELMHVLGFYHEQSRTDRDQFVTIQYDNIEPQETRQFQKYSEKELDELGYQYDYGSIMHYQRNAFALYDNLTTIVPNRPGVQIGQRVSMSPLDVKKLRRLFKCTLATCKSKEFKCKDESACIPDVQRCDGRSQCDDGSDEQNCHISCKPYQFMCSNKCIPRAWLCDGQSDCPDGADERPSNCPSSCLRGYFQCKAVKTNQIKKCLPLWRRCDGHVDCPGGDDENSAQCQHDFAVPVMKAMASASPAPSSANRPLQKLVAKNPPPPPRVITPYAIETGADPCLIPSYYYNPQYYNYCYYSYRARQTAQQYGTLRAYQTLSPFSDGGLFADPIENIGDARSINTVCGLPQTAITKARAGIVGLNTSYIIDQALCSNLLVLSGAVRDAAYDNDHSPSTDDDEEPGKEENKPHKIIPKIEFPIYAADFVRSIVEQTQQRKQKQLQSQQWSERRMEVYVGLDVGTGASARLLSDMVRFAANVPKLTGGPRRRFATKRRRSTRSASAQQDNDSNSALEEFGEAVRQFARSINADGIVLDWRSSSTKLSTFRMASPEVILSVIKQLDIAFHQHDPDKGPNKLDLFLGLILSPTTVGLATNSPPEMLRHIINTVDFVMYSNDPQRIDNFDVIEPLNKLFLSTVLSKTADSSIFSSANLTQKIFLGLSAGGKDYLLPKNHAEGKTPLKFGTKAAGAGFRGGRVSSNPAIVANNEICRLLAGAPPPASRGRQSLTKSFKTKAAKSIYTLQKWQNTVADNDDKGAIVNELVAFQAHRDLLSYETTCSFAQKIALFKNHNVLSVSNAEENEKTKQIIEKQPRKYAGIFIEDITLDDTLGECAALKRTDNKKPEEGDTAALSIYPMLNVLSSYSFIQQVVETCALRTDT